MKIKMLALIIGLMIIVSCSQSPINSNEIYECGTDRGDRGDRCWTPSDTVFVEHKHDSL